VTSKRFIHGRWACVLLAVLSAGLFCESAHGQALLRSQQIDQFERQLEQLQREKVLRIDASIPAEQRALVDYGGALDFSLFSIDDAFGNTHALRQTELSAYARLNFDNAHEFYVRVLTRYRDFNSGDSFDGHGDDWVEPQLERAFYRFDLRAAEAAYEGRTTDFNLTAQLGRQLVHWANGLTLSQDLDGGVFDFNWNKLTLTALAAFSRQSNVDIDTSRPDFDGDTRRGFFGGKVDYQVAEAHRLFAYGLLQADQNSHDFNPDPFSAQRINDPTLPLLPTTFKYESYYLGVGASGSVTDQLIYSIEAVYEGGSTLSNSFALDVLGNATPIKQTTDPISAAALDARLDYLFNDLNHSRAMLELVVATGDSDRLTSTNTFGGNKPNTTDRGFNGFGLVQTGLAFIPNVSNLVMVHGGVATFPAPDSESFERLQVGADLYVYTKLDAAAPIQEPTSDDPYLGTGLDLYANWQISSDLTWTLRYGLFVAGDAIVTDRGPRHFLFSGLTYAF
jgi:hypothetical protein